MQLQYTVEVATYTTFPLLLFLTTLQIENRRLVGLSLATQVSKKVLHKIRLGKPKQNRVLLVLLTLKQD